MNHLDGTTFGRQFREHFLFSAEYLNMNHGSFGAVPKTVLAAQQALQVATESSPDLFLRFSFLDMLSISRNAIAQYLHTSADQCVFVQNATLGLNTVLRNLPLNGEKSCIIYFDTVYGAIEKTLLSIRETSPNLCLRRVNDYELPCSHSTIVAALLLTIQEAKRDGLHIHACVFETITSVPAARFPFERITEVCRQQGILSVIDGAHGVGQIPIDLGELDPDFFVSNCHKWLYTPRGCAVLHVPRRNHHFIRTTFPTSWGFMPLSSPAAPLPSTGKSETRDQRDEKEFEGEGTLAAQDLEQETTRFLAMFSYVGTADTTAYYVLPAALEFRQTICGGDEKIYSYVHWIAQAGADLLARRLGTRVMDDNAVPTTGNRKIGEITEVSTPKNAIKVDREGDQHHIDTRNIRDCAMANVCLPFVLDGGEAPNAPSTEPHPFPPISVPRSSATEISSYLTRTLMHNHKVAVSVFPYKENIWLRISGQLYLELHDFESLADILIGVLQDTRTKTWL